MNEALLYWGVALVAIALLLMIIEAFVPSGGIIGAVSVAVAIAGVVCLFRYSVSWGVSGGLAVLVLFPAAFFGALSMLPNTPFGRALLGAESEEERAARLDAEQHARDMRRALVDLEGVALTDLRPVGEVEIEGERYEALAEGGLIDVGERVRVTAVDMMQVTVRRVS